MPCIQISPTAPEYLFVDLLCSSPEDGKKGVPSRIGYKPYQLCLV
jgi:hypothetical protein